LTASRTVNVTYPTCKCFPRTARSVTCLHPPQQHARSPWARSGDVPSGSAPTAPKPNLLFGFRKQNKVTLRFAGWTCARRESAREPLKAKFTVRSCSTRLATRTDRRDLVTVIGCRPSSCTLNRPPAQFQSSPTASEVATEPRSPWHCEPISRLLTWFEYGVPMVRIGREKHCSRCSIGTYHFFRLRARRFRSGYCGPGPARAVPAMVPR
jgi:hypothetical protein